MRKITVLAGLLAAALAGGCYESTPFDDDDHPDAGDTADVAPDVEDDAGAEDAAEEAASCGDEKEPRSTLSYIVAGTESFDPSVVLLSDGQVLAVGALMQRDRRTGTFSIVCTATLVTDTVVLTAAHCVLGWMGPTRAADLRFAVGTDILAPVYTFDVSAVHANPAYRPSGGADQARDDQAVVILTEPASSLVPEIRPIPINRNPLPDAFMSTLVQNVGYGTTSASGGDNTLRWWTVETVTEITDYDYTVYGGGISSVCFGDSGGPGMWGAFADGAVHVAGTVSWGDPSCVDYDHFARTDDNIDFLLPYVGSDDPCGGLGWEGRCDPGDVAVWCIDGITYRRDCAACSQTCGDAGPSLGFYCI